MMLANSEMLHHLCDLQPEIIPHYQYLILEM